jgi:hypothetical protein
MKASYIQKVFGVLLLTVGSLAISPTAYAQEDAWQKFLRQDRERTEQQQTARTALEEKAAQQQAISNLQKKVDQLENSRRWEAAPPPSRDNTPEQTNRTTTRMVNTPNGLKMCRTIGSYETCH